MHSGICCSLVVTHVPACARSSRRVITQRRSSDTVPGSTLRPDRPSLALSAPPLEPMTVGRYGGRSWRLSGQWCSLIRARGGEQPAYHNGAGQERTAHDSPPRPTSYILKRRPSQGAVAPFFFISSS